MSPRANRARPFYLLLAVVQFALPPAVGLADARLEANGKTPAGRVHIESHTTGACAHLHPHDCALCQFLSFRFNAPGPTLTLSTRHHSLPLPATTQLTDPTFPIRLPHPRAPPTLL
jgi:hypothetical protein